MTVPDNSLGRLQSNLAHLETHIRVCERLAHWSDVSDISTHVKLVVQFADVRILALGVLNNPRGKYSVNPNARRFLHPPGIEAIEGASETEDIVSPPQSPQTVRTSLDSQHSTAPSIRSSAPDPDGELNLRCAYLA